MAAAVATALIGGSLLIERLGGILPGAGPAADFDLAGVPSLNWPAEDPLLHTAPLQELTVEELEVLLAEME